MIITILQFGPLQPSSQEQPEPLTAIFLDVLSFHKLSHCCLEQSNPPHPVLHAQIPVVLLQEPKLKQESYVVLAQEKQESAAEAKETNKNESSQR